MRKPWTLILPIVWIVLAACAAEGLARADSSSGARVDALERQIQEMQRLYEARIAALEREVAALKGSRAAAAPGETSAAPTTAEPPAGAAQVPPPAPSEAPSTALAPPVPEAPPIPTAPLPAGAPQTSNYFNPSISVIGNFLGVGGKNRTENLPSASLRESEVSFQAIVDPYARADFFLSFGEEGVDVEEGFITFPTLPLGFLAKVGRMRVSFGKINPLHLHVLPWADEPLPVVNLLGGDEGWIGTGASAAHLVPLPAEIFSEVTVQAFRGDSGGLFEAPKRGDLAYNARYRVFKDLSEATNLDVGFSYAMGPNGETEISDTRLEGIDATLRWKPLRTATYRSASFRGELIRSRREQPGGDQKAGGWFLSGEYQLAKRWFVGARAEAAEHADDESLRDKGQAALLTFWPSEFSQIRGEFRRRRYADVETANEVLLQIQFAIGAHGAHPF